MYIYIYIYICMYLPDISSLSSRVMVSRPPVV